MRIFLLILLISLLLPDSQCFTPQSFAGRKTKLSFFSSQDANIAEDEYCENERVLNVKRRYFLNSMLLGGFLSPSLSSATEDVNSKEQPEITSKVKFNVRISRADGTFYTRDDETDKDVFNGSLIFGLYGKLAPNHVEKFLSYAQSYSPLEDNPLPTYSRSQFSSLNQSNGLLTAGFIPGLQLSTFAGSSVLEYRGRILPSNLWIEKNQFDRISHSRAGLLTHRDLDVLPTFGITTRASKDLDSTNTVFGTIIDTESSKAFLDRCIDLPTYSLDRPAVPVGEYTGNPNSRATEEVASSLYSLQKEFFRNAAKSFGDTRLDNVYEGKILRRVEVVSTEIL